MTRAIADYLGIPLRVVWTHVITFLILNGGDGFPILVAWCSVPEVKHLTVAKKNEDLTLSHPYLPMYIQKPTPSQVLKEDNAVYFLAVLMGTKLTDWSRPGLNGSMRNKKRLKITLLRRFTM